MHTEQRIKHIVEGIGHRFCLDVIKTDDNRILLRFEEGIEYWVTVEKRADQPHFAP